MKAQKHSRKMQTKVKKAQALILGCGTSTGVPLISCDCKVCKSKNPRNNRTRASLLLKLPSSEAPHCHQLLIDTSTDLRAQVLREKIQRIDAVLYTHPHSDHLSGIDEIRSFNYIQRQSIPAYVHDWTYHELQARYRYIFHPTLNEGGGIPRMDLNRFELEDSSFKVLGHEVIPLKVMHGSQECAGFRVQSFAYITDCSLIPKTTLTRLNDLDVLVLDCIRLSPHNTHFNFEQAISLIEMIKPRKTYLTHMGHDFEYNLWTKRGRKALLPKGVTLAYDGLKIPFDYSL